MPENYQICSSVNHFNGASEPKVTLAYWNIRGLANPIRHLLEYLEVPYVDKLYNIEAKEDGTYSRDYSYNSYFEYKKNTLSKEMGFTPNLPYLIDGDHTFSQSRAIMKHISMKFGTPTTLGGPEYHQQTHCFQLFETSRDIVMSLVRLAYGSAGKEAEFETAMKDLCEGTDMQNFFHDIKYFLGTKNFLFSDTDLSMADFGVYDTLDGFRKAGGDSLEVPDDIAAYMKRFESVPQIKRYHNSDDYLRYQLNNKIAVYEGNHKKN